MPIETKSSWSAAAGIDWMLAGIERMRCSTISMSAVYWLSIMPENMPAPLVRNSGKPTLSAGLVRRFKRRSDSTHTIVMAALIMSIGSETGDVIKVMDQCRLAGAKSVSLAAKQEESS